MKYRINIIIIISLVLCASCKKYLDAKSDESLSTPGTLEDLQAILDGGILNSGMQITNIGTDEYYMTDADWSSYPDEHITKMGHIWDPQTNDLDDWKIQYNTVFYANTVLDNLQKISKQGQELRWNNIKGSALFYRARCFYEIAQGYGVPYNEATAASDLGIPLRLSSDFNKLTTRATIKESYERIIEDLQNALPLLPVTPQNQIRPGRPAAFALLARAYLMMGNYEKAKVFADSCLLLFSTIVDYNSIPVTGSYSFQRFNPEVIFHATVDAVNGNFGVKVDSNLFNSYAADDLRKSLYFDANNEYIGSYNGDFQLFNGIATDEVYLIRAECYARENNVSAAMQDLNTLLIRRWATGTFIPYSPSNTDQALSLILQERKKELINRGTRWSDLRRLNTDSRFAITLKREINGQTYTLSPNDLRYTWLIPVEVINLIGIPQNGR